MGALPKKRPHTISRGSYSNLLSEGSLSIAPSTPRRVRSQSIEFSTLSPRSPSPPLLSHPAPISYSMSDPYSSGKDKREDWRVTEREERGEREGRKQHTLPLTEPLFPSLPSSKKSFGKKCRSSTFIPSSKLFTSKKICVSGAPLRGRPTLDILPSQKPTLRRSNSTGDIKAHAEHLAKVSFDQCVTVQLNSSEFGDWDIQTIEEVSLRRTLKKVDSYLVEKDEMREMRLDMQKMKLNQLKEKITEKDKKKSTQRKPVKIFIVVNRLSGKGRKANVEKVVGEEGPPHWRPFFFYIKTGKEDLEKEITERVIKKKEFDWVFGCGGDGTISSLVTLLSGTRIPFGVVPLGTGNAFAQEMRIPLEWKYAIKMLALHDFFGKLVPRAVDVMKLGDENFMLTIDIGIGARTVEDAALHPERKRQLGVWAYLVSASKAIQEQKPMTYQMVIDGVEIEKKANELVICNAGMLGVGNDIRWGPDISVDDGILNICFINAKNMKQNLSVIKSLVSQKAENSKFIDYATASTSIQISCAEGEVPVAGDGDFIGHLPVEIEVLQGAVSVLLPAKNTSPINVRKMSLNNTNNPNTIS